MFYTDMVSRQSFKQKVIHDRLKFYLTPSNHNLQVFANAVRTGLSSRRKFLLPQYFYDEKGSKLFEKISKLPKYYLTKLEGSILASNSDEIASICNRVALVELGSGNSRKTRTILQALLARQESLQYFPIDISYEMLKASSEALLDNYESLSITATVAEYDKGMFITKKDIRDRKLVLFLGSSIGNFDPIEAKRFMQMIRNHLQDQDMVLIGLDMHKDSRVLNAA
ncbi:MAG: L-histidine N(alpha)-methyltransferase, partial [Nitrososphaerales archaeon]